MNKTGSPVIQKRHYPTLIRAYFRVNDSTGPGFGARPHMRFSAAVIREQGVTFAVVIVKPHTLRSTHEATRAQIAFAPAFPGVPIVLMAQDSMGAATFHGRNDLVAFLSNIQPDAIRWREYSYGR